MIWSRTPRRSASRSSTRPVAPVDPATKILRGPPSPMAHHNNGVDPLFQPERDHERDRAPAALMPLAILAAGAMATLISIAATPLIAGGLAVGVFVVGLLLRRANRD